MTRIEILVEEPSIKEFLTILLPKVLDENWLLCVLPMATAPRWYALCAKNWRRGISAILRLWVRRIPILNTSNILTNQNLEIPMRAIHTTKYGKYYLSFRRLAVPKNCTVFRY